MKWLIVRGMRILLGGKTENFLGLISGVKIKYPNRISKLTKNFFYLRLNFSYKRFCFACVWQSAEGLWNNGAKLKLWLVSKKRNGGRDGRGALACLSGVVVRLEHKKAGLRRLTQSCSFAFARSLDYLRRPRAFTIAR